MSGGASFIGREIWLARLEATAEDLQEAARSLHRLIQDWDPGMVRVPDRDLEAVGELNRQCFAVARRLRERAAEEQGQSSAVGSQPREGGAS